MKSLKTFLTSTGLILMASLSLAAQAAKPIAPGTVLAGTFLDKGQKDVWVFDAEAGATYEITVVDGYNSKANAAEFPLKNPIHATLTRVQKDLDASMAYDPSVYTTLNDDKNGGWTPSKASGPVARISAAGTKVYVIVAPDSKKNTYPGDYGIKVVKR